MFDLESYLEICFSLDFKNKYDTQIRRIAGADLRPAAAASKRPFQKETRMMKVGGRAQGRGCSVGTSAAPSKDRSGRAGATEL